MKKGRIVIGALVALCICSIIGVIIQRTSPTYQATATAQAMATATEATRPTNTPAPTNTPGPTATPAPTPTITPTLSPTDQLRLAIQTTLGDGNRDLPRVQEFDFNDGTIWVVWAINDNLTKGWIVYGAQSDIADILRAIDNTGIDYNRVDLLGTFSMVDAYGNTKESDVISVSYNKETVDRINWSNFSPDNIYTIADEVLVLHPEFRP